MSDGRLFRVGKVRLPPLEQDSGKGRFVNTACDLKRWSSDFGARNGEFLKMGWTFQTRIVRVGSDAHEICGILEEIWKRSKFFIFLSKANWCRLYLFVFAALLIVWETGLSGLKWYFTTGNGRVFSDGRLRFARGLLWILCMWGRFDIDFLFCALKANRLCK